MKLKKEFGQHLLINTSILNKISSMTETAEYVVEIGPGTGNLTEHLLKNTNIKELFLIEKDPDMVEKLKARFDDPRIKLFNMDATQLNISAITDQKVAIIGNFPYNVGNEIIINLVEQIENITKIVAMLQKEVVERFCAKPKTKDYGKLTVLCGSFCNAKKSFDISPSNFVPPPKVMSSILELIPHNKPIDKNVYKNVVKICSIGFGQRRKKLLPVLKPYFSEEKISEISNFLSNQNARIEELTIEDIIKIAGII